MYLDKADDYGSVDMKVNVKFMSALSDITIKNAAGNKFYVSGTEGSSYVVTSTSYRTGALGSVRGQQQQQDYRYQRHR